MIFLISIHLPNLTPANRTSVGQSRNLILVNFKNELRQRRNFIPAKFSSFKVLYSKQIPSFLQQLQRDFYVTAVPKKFSIVVNIT